MPHRGVLEQFPVDVEGALIDGSSVGGEGGHNDSAINTEPVAERIEYGPDVAAVRGVEG